MEAWKEVQELGPPSHLLPKVADIKEVLLLGFYPAADMASFVAEMNSEYKVSCCKYILSNRPHPASCPHKCLQVSTRYLQEYAPLGTAGGLHHFRDQVL